MNKTIYFTLDPVPNEIFESPEWCLERSILEKKNKYGLPIWVNHKILKDYDPDPNPEQDIIAALNSTNDGDIDKSAVVPKRVRSRKPKSKAAELSDVQQLLDKFVPADNLPESKSAGTDNTVSDSLDS